METEYLLISFFHIHICIKILDDDIILQKYKFYLINRNDFNSEKDFWRKIKAHISHLLSIQGKKNKKLLTNIKSSIIKTHMRLSVFFRNSENHFQAIIFELFINAE